MDTLSYFFMGCTIVLSLILLARWRTRRPAHQRQAPEDALKIIPTSGSAEAVIPLGSLPPKARAEIVLVDERCQGFARRRFLDLGLTPGTLIYPELENAFKDPRAYRVRGTLIALRSDQAAWIWVRPAVE